MSSIAVFDIFLRGCATLALLFVAVAFAYKSMSSRKSLSVATLSVSVAAYLLVSSPFLKLSDGWPSAVLVPLAGVVPVFAYWAGIELFVDRPELRWWHWLVALLVTLGAWLFPILPGVAPLRGILVVLISSTSST